MSGIIRLFFAGDVMTGRGIDQLLPSPSDPGLYESYVRDARVYVELAELASGPIARPADFVYVWGDALDALTRAAPDARIVNLETAVTRSGDRWPGKGIHYRMHPDNTPCLTRADLDCCVLANNHVLDWGRVGLEETLSTLHRAGLATAGAGRDRDEALAPAAVDLGGGRRILVFGFGSESSGIPGAWAAEDDRSGVNLLPAPASRATAVVREAVERFASTEDVVVVSIHWGGNWGYEIPQSQRVLAHALIDEGKVDIIHGHSSHHAKRIEMYRGKPILYGCGDFLNDYEGISGHEAFRADLRLGFLLDWDMARRCLAGIEIVSFRSRRLSLRAASRTDVEWLCAMLARECRAFDIERDAKRPNVLLLRPQCTGASER